MPTRTQRLIVDTPTSKLQAEIYINPKAPTNAPGILLVHPHALLGGTMHDYVIEELFENAIANPEIGAVLRYNQRGVGTSTGSKLSFRNLKGQQDAADVLEMVDFLSKQLEDYFNSVNRVVIIGYSFGSVLASYAVSHPSVALYIAISFPIGGLSVLVQTKKRLDVVLGASHIPRLFVLGCDDQFSKEDVFRGILEAGGGVVMQEDSSFEPSSPPVGGGDGGGNSGSDKTKVGLRDNGRGGALQLKLYAMNDHFWGNDGAAMAEWVVSFAVSAIESKNKLKPSVE